MKRKRVRAGILICSPVAGLRPIRALVLRLRNTPRPAKRSEPSFLSWRVSNSLSSSSADFACPLLMADLVGQISRHLRLGHPPPPKPLSLLNNMHDRSAKFKIGFASTASRLYEFEPNGAASARLRRFGCEVRPARDFKLNNCILSCLK